MTIDGLFLWSSIIGGILFLAQLVLQLVGWGADGDALSGDALSGDAGGQVHTSADASFKVLSLQGLTAFVMMFGLVGLAMRRENGLGPGVALLGAVCAGSVAAWVIAQIFRFFAGLQSSGTLDLKRAVGVTGQVYLTILRDKPGKVQIAVNGRMLTLDATTAADKPLPTGTTVRVVSVIDAGQVVVEAVP